MHIARGQGPFEIASEGNAHDCGNAAPIQCVTLHDDYRPSDPRTGARGSRKVRPPDLAL
jgi:hypothetical protein